jgi:hypothetical protein
MAGLPPRLRLVLQLAYRRCSPPVRIHDIRGKSFHRSKEIKMDFQTRFTMTRWIIRGFGLFLMLGVIPSIGFMTIQAWRRLMQMWRTQHPSDGEPEVQVQVLKPAPPAMQGGITAALRKTAPTPQLSTAQRRAFLPSAAKPLALPAPQED